MPDASIMQMKINLEIKSIKEHVPAHPVGAIPQILDYVLAGVDMFGTLQQSFTVLDLMFLFSRQTV